jgi:hypothetical protein
LFLTSSANVLAEKQSEAAIPKIIILLIVYLHKFN